MPKPRAYVETTIPNFYYDPRTEPELVARRNWTREWWSDAAERYELVTSASVMQELAAGTGGLVRRRMDLIRHLPSALGLHVPELVTPRDLLRRRA